MSRYYDGDYDSNFANEGDFWRHNADLALAGRKGRRALADLREALMALPDKRLIAGALCTAERKVELPPPVPTVGFDWAYRHAKSEAEDCTEDDGEGINAEGFHNVCLLPLDHDGAHDFPPRTDDAPTLTCLKTITGQHDLDRFGVCSLCEASGLQYDDPDWDEVEVE